MDLDKKRILVVEDDAVNRKLFKTLLQDLNYETIEAEDGEQAVALAKENIPALILMDVQMPVMDGTAALKILRADNLTSKIPVIAVTACVMKGDKERFSVEGFDSYISKPINVSEFIKTVKTILGE